MPATQTYLGELELLAGERSWHKQSELLEKITDLFFITHQQQSARDRALFGAVFHRICSDVDKSVLVSLAEKLSQINPVPEEIVSRLILDEYQIAKPLLEKSHSISDTMLVDVLESNISSKHSQSIAGRRHLSRYVTDTILAESDDQTLLLLAENTTANISKEAMAFLCQLAPHNPALLGKLLERPDLRGNTYTRLIEDIDHQLRQKISLRFPQLNKKRVQHVSDARMHELLEEYDQSENDTFSPARKSVFDQDNKSGKLTQYTVAEQARAGNISETVYTLGLLSGVEAHIVHHILFHAELPALSVLAKSAALRRENFSILLNLRANHKNLPKNGIEAALKRYDDLNIEKAKEMLDFLKHRLENEDIKKGVL